MADFRRADFCLLITLRLAALSIVEYALLSSGEPAVYPTFRAILSIVSIFESTDLFFPVRTTSLRAFFCADLIFAIERKTSGYCTIEVR